MGSIIFACGKMDCEFAGSLNKNAASLPDSPEACPYEEPAPVQKSAILAVGTAVPGCPDKGCEFAGIPV